MENATSVILVKAFGIKAGKENGETPAKLISHLARLALLKIDEVSNGIPGLKGHNARKFRKHEAAVEYLENESFAESHFGVTQRAEKRGDWDVGSSTLSATDSEFRVVFPSDNPKGDNRVLPLLNELVRFGAHYAFSMEAESHLYAACYSFGCELSGRMSRQVVENMSILGNAMFKGERFARRVIDVYPLQVLNGEHLSATVGGTALGARIETESWGRLQQMEADRWLWELSSADLSRARAVMLGSDFTLAKL
jgi:hypothetical protein